MASREEINSGMGDTIKAAHGPTSRHCRQVLIHKARCLSRTKREAGGLFSYLYQGFELQRPITMELQARLHRIRLRISLSGGKTRGSVSSGCGIIDENVHCKMCSTLLQISVRLAYRSDSSSTCENLTAGKWRRCSLEHFCSVRSQ